MGRGERGPYDASHDGGARRLWRVQALVYATIKVTIPYRPRYGAPHGFEAI